MLGTKPRWANSASYRAAASGVTASRSNNLMREFSLVICTQLLVRINAVRISYKITHANSACQPLVNRDGTTFQRVEPSDCSKRVAQRELNQTRRAHCRENFAESRVRDVGERRVSKIRTIPDVEEIRGEAQ